MAWWMFLLVAAAGYTVGFLVSGVLYSYLSKMDGEDLIGAMIFWPIVLPCWFLTIGVVQYAEFLESTRKSRKIRVQSSKGVNTATILEGRWETHE